MGNLQVTLRQEATNESNSLNTNAQGEAIFQLGSPTQFPSGFTIGNKITASVMYNAFQVYKSYTIDATGGVVLELTLVALPSAPTLRYFTAQDFLDYYDMKIYEDDQQIGVKLQQLVQIGEMIEGGIDDDTGTRFDNNNSVSTEYHNATKNQSVFFLTKGPLISVKGFWSNQADEDSNPIWRNLAYISHDTMDSTTNWSGSSANSEVTLSINRTPSNSNSSLACMYIAKAGANDTTLTISRSNLTSTDFTDKTLNIDLYLDDTDELASSDAVTLRFGSSSGAYYQLKFDRSKLSDGWNPLAFIYNDTATTVTGAPTITACTYFAIILELVTAATTWTAGDARLDNFRYSEQYDLDIETGVRKVKITKEVNWPVQGHNQVKVDYTYGRSSIPLDIKELSILQTGLRMFGAAFMKGKIRGKVDVRHDFTEWFDAFRNRIIMKYNITGVDSV